MGYKTKNFKFQKNKPNKLSKKIYKNLPLIIQIKIIQKFFNNTLLEHAIICPLDKSSPPSQLTIKPPAFSTIETIGNISTCFKPDSIIISILPSASIKSYMSQPLIF